MTEQNKSCVDCGSTNLDTEPRRMLDGVFVCQCRDCGLLVLDRFPPQKPSSDAAGMFDQSKTGDFNPPQGEMRC